MAPTGHIALSLDTLVFGERLQASVREMDAALRATSTVASVNYGVTGAALFDAQGRCLAMTVSDPLIFASVRIAPRALIDAFVFDLEDGDVLMANHPDYGGVAPTIVTIVAPVIVDAQYAGAAAVQYRLADLGGDLPGGWNMGATEWLAEGIALPPVKIVRAGRKAFDVWDMLQLNSREPADLAWNLDAALGACRIGAEQIKRLVQHWGSAGFERLSTDYLAYTGRLCRTLLGVVSSPATAEEEAVVVLPDGSVVRVRVAARLDDQTLSIDLGGSDNVTRSGSYPPLAATLGAVLFTVISGWAELLPLNDGTFSPITVSTRRGSVVNPPANAATTMGSELILPAVAQASSRVLAELSMGHRSAVWPRLPKFAAYTPPPGSRVRLSSGQPLFPGALSEVDIPSAEELERDSAIRVVHRERREGSSTVDVALANLGATARICIFEGDGTVHLPGGNAPAAGWSEWVAGQSIEMSYRGEELPHE